jgi:hypothetical protein
MTKTLFLFLIITSTVTFALSAKAVAHPLYKNHQVLYVSDIDLYGKNAVKLDAIFFANKAITRPIAAPTTCDVGDNPMICSTTEVVGASHVVEVTAYYFSAMGSQQVEIEFYLPSQAFSNSQLAAIANRVNVNSIIRLTMTPFQKTVTADDPSSTDCIGDFPDPSCHASRHVRRTVKMVDVRVSVRR